jgi:hypothetical protein
MRVQRLVGLGLVLATACSDPPTENSSAEDTETDEGETGDGDGDPETVVLDLFNNTCGPTATWTSLTPGLMPIDIPCDMAGLEANGWMVRYVELMLGDVEFNKVLSLVAGITDGSQIQGTYSLADVADPETLEFRAELLVACAGGDSDCAGRFVLALTNGDGAFVESEDRELDSAMEAVAIAVPLLELETFTEPSIVLIAERTEPDTDPAPELLIVNPRLVLP